MLASRVCKWRRIPWSLRTAAVPLHANARYLAPPGDIEEPSVCTCSRHPHSEGTFRGLPEGSKFTETFGGQSFTFGITYHGGTGNDVVLNAVPEPNTLISWRSALHY